MLTVLYIILCVVGLMAAPFLALFAVILLLMPLVIIAYLLDALVSILTWRPKHPFYENEFDIRQVEERNEGKVGDCSL